MEGTIGEIRGFAGNFAPRNWAICEGQLIAINSNQALYSILGTTFGGDGKTTFGLPDCRGRATIGPGHGAGLTNRTLGNKGGVETVTLDTTQIPAHNHTANPGYSSSPASNSPDSNYPAQMPAGTNVYGTKNDGNMGAAVVGNTGGGKDHENMMPYIAINQIICLTGTFPSRS